MLSLPLTLLALVAPAQVSSVVVFPDRAQVTREQTVPCSGKALATFESLPPAAEPASFVALADGASVESLMAEERPLSARFGPELEALGKKREALERELAELADARARDQALEKLAEGLSKVAVQRVSSELAEPKPDVRSWKGAFDAALATRLRPVSEVAARAARQRELQRALETVRAREAWLSASSERLERRVEVRLACRSGRARVSLQYVVGGAGWTPVYEARADEAHQRVRLSSFATVHQRTGEDWSDVSLVLSTALPRANASPPVLQPLTLRAQEREPERKVLVRREEYREHAEAPGGSGSAESEGAVRAAAQGISVQLVVPGKAEVPGDGSSVRLLVARTWMDAVFSWRAVPKLHPVFFRVARLVNGAPFPLLPGPVDVFRSSGFIGRQELERVAQGGPFSLSFGLEESLRVERLVVEEVSRDSGFLGSHRRFRYAYRFKVANQLPRAESVEIAEHIPVSELDDVHVELDSKQTSEGYSLEPADGIVSWKVKLAPAEQRSLDLAFHVDVPNSYDSGGM
jgi:uncharacterized protein (TIGR02231 family)